MRRAAARSQCANNLEQIALGLNDYAAAHPLYREGAGTEPAFPAGTVANPGLSPERRLSWLVEVLPFVEQKALFERIDRKAAWDAEANAPATRQPMTRFHCPDWGREYDPAATDLTAYVGPAGLGPDAPLLPAGDPRAGIFGYDRRTALADITDGAANTLLILETARDNGPWAQGGPGTVRGLDTADQPYLGRGRPFGGTHFSENTLFSRGGAIGCHVALADGSVRFVNNSMSPSVLEALLTVRGGEAVGDW